MKRLFLLLLMLIGIPLGAHAQSVGQSIQSFDVQAELDSERNLIVTENIQYDFGAIEKHGIYRNIPETYNRDGATYGYDYEVLLVQRDGFPEQYEVSRDGKMMNLKIGKADVTIQGKHRYTIRYKTNRAVNFFEDGHSELYWNVTGNEWQVPMAKSSFLLIPPNDNVASSTRFSCFTGAFGSQEAACEMQQEGNNFRVFTTRVLQPAEGMTVVFGFAKGVIREETANEKMMRIIGDNWYLVLPLFALALMLYLWSTKGKDPSAETIIPQYEVPRGMSPMVLSAALGNGSIPDKGVTATIIDMARKGYLHIEYGTKKILFIESQTYTFVMKKKPGDEATEWERRLWDGMFSNGSRERATIEDLKEDEFYKDVQSAKTKGVIELHKLKIFAASPAVVRTIYLIGAFVVFMVVLVVTNQNALSNIVAFITALIVAVFGWFMPKRTKEGTSIVAEVKGFKWFLSVTEEERIKFHNAPARTPEQFMDFLPAAIALGVEKQWAKQFEDLHLAPPDWAEGNVSALNSIALASALSGMERAAASAYAPPSSAGSGGSGFSGGGSGGGGGGGGGGSW